MKKIAAFAGAALLALSLAVPVTPVSAQSFSFGFGVGVGSPGWGLGYGGPGFGIGYGVPGYGYRYRGRSGCYWHDCGGVRYRARRSIDYYDDDYAYDDDYDRRDGSWRRHVARCEANYRSYDRDTDMFLGYDGDYHYCRL